MIKELLIGLGIVLITLYVGHLTILNISENLDVKITQIGAPLDIPWASFVLATIMTIIVAISLSVSDGGINPGRQI